MKLVVAIPVVVLLKLLLQGMRPKLVAMIPASVAMAENSKNAVGEIYKLVANQLVKN